MKLQIVSQNLQGVNHVEAPLKVRNYFQPHLSHTSVLCFQEHKLRGNKMTDFGHKVWRSATFYGCEASIGYNHGDGHPGAGRGGICMFVSPQLTPHIHSYGVIGQNLGQWVRLSDIQGGDVAILNIYAPHSNPNARSHLWESRIQSLDPNCRWVMCGDSNMVESLVDKSSSCGRILLGFEKVAFDRLKAHLQVEDFFDHSSLIPFTWDSKRKDGHRVFARLDRIYAFPHSGMNNRAHVSFYDIWRDNYLSDHLPVRMAIQLSHDSQSGSNYKMSSYFLDDPTVVAKLDQIWLTSPPTFEFFGKIRRMTRWYRNYCLQQAKARRARTADLKAKVSEAEAAL